MADPEVTVVVEKYGSPSSSRWYKQIDPPEPKPKPPGYLVEGPDPDYLAELINRKETEPIPEDEEKPKTKE